MLREIGRFIGRGNDSLDYLVVVTQEFFTETPSGIPFEERAGHKMFHTSKGLALNWVKKRTYETLPQPPVTISCADPLAP